MSRRTILVVDDEPKLVEMVREYLEHDGYRVESAADGREALERFRRARPDLLILDLMLPELDGYEVCRRLRRESEVPIIMLTARDQEPDELVGLEMGADDYVTKPFSPRTLLARVRSVLRRSTLAEESETPLVLGPLRVDPARHEASWEEVPLVLTSTEFRLLAALVRRPRRVFGRLELLEQLQGESYAGYERTVDAHVKNLRKKLAGTGGEAASASLVTVPGVGYKMEVPGA